MRLLNLFDGIGGFGLAAKWMGWENVASCEIDPYCRRVLDYWFDYKYIYNDITTADFTPLRGNIDLVTGGFPCQPFSLAGKQLGEKDERYLWPHMLRAIREVRPRWVVAENVRGLITQSGGVVFEQVCAGLEAAGYEVQPFILPAAGVGAPHRRDRLWIVAHAADAGAESERRRKAEIRGLVDATDSYGDRCRDVAVQHEHRQECEAASDHRDDGANGIADYACSIRRYAGEFHDGEFEKPQEGERRPGKVESRGTDCARDAWREFPTQPPVCRGDDGLSDRLVGITFPKWREQAIKMFGNSIVPQVAYQTYKAIEAYEYGTRNLCND